MSYSFLQPNSNSISEIPTTTSSYHNHPLSGDVDEMIDLTPGNSPSKIFRNSSFNSYSKQYKDSEDSQERGDMDRNREPTHSAFGNDDFADPEGNLLYFFLHFQFCHF